MSHHDCRCLFALALLYIAPKAQNFVLGVSEVFCTVRTIIRTKHETCLKVRKIFGLADILSEVLKKALAPGRVPGRGRASGRKAREPRAS